MRPPALTATATLLALSLIACDHHAHTDGRVDHAAVEMGDGVD